jgi:3-deoxy-7-phosphoheptulonate synthase
MLVIMKNEASDHEIAYVEQVINEMGLRPHTLPGTQRTAIGITGNRGMVDATRIENLPGVAETMRVTKPYKLVSLDLHPEKTTVRVGNAAIGSNELAVIAGPCAVESYEQTFAIAKAVSRSGARFFRGGAYKPRTSPYDFQGLGEKGLKILAEVREEFDLKIVTEAVNEESLELIEEYGDVIQIGARNMQNFSLLRRAGCSGLPVLLKRGIAATLDEWLLAAEYIMAEGNYNVILCERGVRTFTQHSRNTLDLAAILAARQLSHLPIIVDPSHAAGKTHMVTPLARAGVAVGTDGLIVEVHHQPECALSDGIQALNIEQFEQMMVEVMALHKVLASCSEAGLVYA